MLTKQQQAIINVLERTNQKVAYLTSDYLPAKADKSNVIFEGNVEELKAYYIKQNTK